MRKNNNNNVPSTSKGNVSSANSINKNNNSINKNNNSLSNADRKVNKSNTDRTTGNTGNTGNKGDKNNIDYEKDEKYAENKIIQKVMKKGFESLTVEELAVTMISPSFETEYMNKAGEEWSKENKSKAVERLNYAKFNIQWNTAKSNSPFGVLFELVEKGDIQRVTEYLRKNAQYQEELLYCVDKSKKSVLHVAAKAGHTNLVSVLISRGYSIHMRDKFLRTPLHTACQNGRGTVADVLIKSGSDIYARDSIGRTALHYAACSNSVELIVLILGIDPDLVHTKDVYGRSPLHYVVWNGNFNQLEMGRKLLDAKAEVDALDEEQMTPLHYAADAGKGKIIPLLLKYGGNPFIRDGRTHRTALELALTEHIREIIIVYSGKPYSMSKEDKDQMTLSGQKVNADEVKSEEVTEMDINKRGRQKSQPKKKPLQTIDEIKEPGVSISQDNMNEFLFKSQKEKLVSFLRNIQEYGVKSMQHLSKPSLYSGSWLESVNNIEDLFQALNKLSPTEAILRIFNIISPFQHSFPQGKGEEGDMACFFVDGVNHNMNTTNNFNPGFQNEPSNLFTIQKGELNDLKEEIRTLKTKIENEEVNRKTTADNELINSLKSQIVNKETENNQLKLNSERLLDNIKSLSESLKFQKSLNEESQRKEEQSRRLAEDLKNQIREMRSEVSRLQDSEKKVLQSTLSNNIGFGIKTISITDDKYRDLSLNEEKSVYVFLKLIEDKSLGLDQLLTQYDLDNDLHIFKNEMINLIDEIKLPMEDRAAVIKLAGFDGNKIKMPMKIIIDNFYKREERKNQKLNELLFKIAFDLHRKSIEVEKVYKFLKLNKENTLSYLELRQGMSSLDLIMPENEAEVLFRCLSINDENKISLDEFVDKLKIRKKILDEIGDVDNKLKFNIKQEGSENYQLKEKNEEKTEVENSKAFDYNDLIMSRRTKDPINNENDNKSHHSKNEEFLNETVQDEILTEHNQSQNISNTEDNADPNQKIIDSYFKAKNSLPANPNAKSKQPMPLRKQTEVFPSNQKINGELKIQVKCVESLILPSSLSKPYSLYLTGSLKGVDIETDSREILSDNLKKVDFNWATRIMIKNKTLTEVGSLFKLELKIKTNKQVPVLIGECQMNWTTTLLDKNWDLFVIDDRFQLLSKRMSNVGIIAVQAKFIPFGSVNSLFDKSGKNNKVPVAIKALVKEKVEEIGVCKVEDNLNEEQVDNNEEKVDNNEEQVDNNEEQVDNNVNNNEDDQEEETIIKSITVELLNIMDKHHFSNKENLFVTINDSSNSDNEIFSTRDTVETFSDILNNLPYSFNFNVYSTNKADKIPLNLYLKDKSGIEDVSVGKIPLEFAADQNYLSFSDKYNIEILRKNYFKVNKNKTGAASNLNLAFYLKFTIENVDGGQEKEENVGDEENFDNI